MKYDAVIFDLDGTLLNTLDDLRDSVNYALEANGFPQRSTDEVRSFVGNGIRLLVERSVPEGTEVKKCNEVFEAFKTYYSKNCSNKTRPYDGITELLRQLKKDGIKTAIVSNKADSAVKKLAAAYFGNLVSAAIGEREGILKKTAPDSVFEAVRLLNSKRTLYVGDSEVDVKTARNAGIDGAFVTWGFRTVKLLTEAGASTFADSTEQLYGIITRQEE